MPEPVKKKSLVEQTFEKFPENAPSKKEFEDFKSDFTNTIKELTLDDVLDAATLTDKAYAPVDQPYSDKSLQSIPMQLPPDKPSSAPQIPERQPDNLPTNDDLRNRLLPPKEEPLDKSQIIYDKLPPEEPVESIGESYRATPETPEPGNQYPPEFKMGGKKPQSPDDGQPDVWNREPGLEDGGEKIAPTPKDETPNTSESQGDHDGDGIKNWDDPDYWETLGEEIAAEDKAAEEAEQAEPADILKQKLMAANRANYAQLDLSPMMALTDAWTGSQLTKEYRRPDTYAMIKEKELEREIAAKKLREQIQARKDANDARLMYYRDRDLDRNEIARQRLQAQIDDQKQDLKMEMLQLDLRERQLNNQQVNAKNRHDIELQKLEIQKQRNAAMKKDDELDKRIKELEEERKTLVNRKLRDELKNPKPKSLNQADKLIYDMNARERQQTVTKIVKDESESAMKKMAVSAGWSDRRFDRQGQYIQKFIDEQSKQAEKIAMDAYLDQFKNKWDRKSVESFQSLYKKELTNRVNAYLSTDPDLKKLRKKK